MADEFLSQDEVDALLAGVNDEEPAVTEQPAEPQGAVRDYDLSRQERIVRGRMPTLEIVHERFSRNVRTGFFEFVRRNPDITVALPQVQKYSVFLGSLTIPANLNIVQVKPLRGSGLIVFEPQLIFAIIDCLFGGNGKTATRIEGREFSATENRIIRCLVDIVIDSYQKAWSGVYPMDLEYVRSEIQTQFASIASPNDIVVSTRFKVEIGGAVGSIHLCIPYSTLEPIRDVLFSTANADQGAHNRSWVSKLGAQLELAEIELTAELANTHITFGEVYNLRVGDFIELELDQTLDVKVNNVPFLRCTYGTTGGNYAVKIDEFLTRADELVPGARQ